MASIYRVPVPKQSKPVLSRDDRLRIQVLFFNAHYTRSQICLETGYSYDQVCYALSHRLTPQKSKCGKRVKLNTPQRKRPIRWVTASQENRQTPWIEILNILGLECGEYAKGQRSKRRAMYGVLHAKNLLFPRRIAKRGLCGHKSI